MKQFYKSLIPAFLFFTGSALQAQEPIAAGSEKFLGNIYSNQQIADFTDYWNQVVPENAGKWGSVERTRDVMDWSGLDAAYALAKDNGLPFRMHVLLWGNQQPAWIENLPAAEQLEEIEEWYAAVAERYPDIDFLEVVNEPINDPPNTTGNGGGNYYEALGGAGETGRDWIVTAFRLAREYFPDAVLMINEYNIVNNTRNIQKYLQIINLLKDENLIDAIGVQAHAFSTQNASAADLKSNLNLLAATELPIYVTEMDIDGPSDQEQLSEYQRVFPIFWEHPGVEGVTLWGWRPGLWRANANLATANGTERPALVWLRDYVERSRLTAIGPDELDQFALYPNPLQNGRFGVKGMERISQVQVFDVSGNRVKDLNVENNSSVQIELNVAPGLYLVKLSDGKNVITKKLVVK